MKHQVASRIGVLGAEAAFVILGRAKQLEAEGRSIVHLEIGEPDFDTPEHIKQAAVKALEEGYTHYTPTPGIPELREAVAESAKKELGIDVEWANNVVITVGGKEAVFAVLMTLLNPGDEVLYPNPGYPAYESVARLAGAKTVPIRLREENEFRVDPDELNQMVSRRTKMIILNSPENPCGSVLTHDDVKGIAEIAVDKDIYMVSDEIYKHIIYGGSRHFSPAAEPGALDNTVIVDGFSKSFAMTGWRLGYLIAPKQLVPSAVKLLNNMTSCPVAFAQKAAVAALRGPMEPVRKMVQKYEERSKAVVSEVNKIEHLHVLEPPGTFYAFVNAQEVLSKAGMNSEDFCRGTLEKQGVALLHGSAMGSFGEGYVRISFANSIENIREGVRRLASAVENIYK
ncbi:MAG: pyridoxal phosphate-dependent aminotransferase [Nitrososphaeria archaeon]